MRDVPLDVARRRREAAADDDEAPLGPPRRRAPPVRMAAAEVRGDFLVRASAQELGEVLRGEREYRTTPCLWPCR